MGVYRVLGFRVHVPIFVGTRDLGNSNCNTGFG